MDIMIKHTNATDLEFSIIGGHQLVMQAIDLGMPNLAKDLGTALFRAAACKVKEENGLEGTIVTRTFAMWLGVN